MSYNTVYTLNVCPAIVMVVSTTHRSCDSKSEGLKLFKARISKLLDFYTDVKCL